jgi:prepilin signal peptidase PulO-like enzyme (type II secretory pathway)
MISAIALLAWLGACVVCDLKSRQVPVLLTLPMLAIASAWQIAQGGWVLALLVIVLILISDLPWKLARISLSLLVAAIAIKIAGTPDHFIAILAIWLAWLLWELGAMGGADAKIIITLVLLFGDGRLLIPIAVIGGVQGLAGMFAGRKAIPYTVAIALGSAAWLWAAGMGDIAVTRRRQFCSERR